MSTQQLHHQLYGDLQEGHSVDKLVIRWLATFDVNPWLYIYVREMTIDCPISQLCRPVFILSCSLWSLLSEYLVISQHNRRICLNDFDR